MEKINLLTRKAKTIICLIIIGVFTIINPNLIKAQCNAWAQSVSVTPDSSVICAGEQVTLNASADTFIDGNALYFDGVNDRVDIPAFDLSNGNQITLEVWVKPTNITTKTYYNITRQQCCRVLPDWLLAFQNHGHILSFGLKTSIGGYKELDVNITAADYTDGNWHHIAATYDGSIMKLYSDGTLIGSRYKSGNVSKTTNKSNIGSMWSKEYFKGYIDEFRIWSITKTQFDIQNGMNCAVSGNESGLVAAWNMDEGSGILTVDVVANYNGLMKNGVSWAPSLVAPICFSPDSITYLWSPANGLNPTTEANVIASPVNTTTYTVTATTSNSCIGTASAIINVNSLPAIVISPTQTVYLGYPPTECVDISASATGGTTPYSYEWSTSETTQEIIVCPSDTTSYTVTITDLNGCSSIATTIVNAVDICCDNEESSSDDSSSDDSSSDDSSSDDSSSDDVSCNKVYITHYPHSESNDKHHNTSSDDMTISSDEDPSLICVKVPKPEDIGTDKDKVAEHLKNGDKLGQGGYPPLLLPQAIILGNGAFCDSSIMNPISDWKRYNNLQMVYTGAEFDASLGSTGNNITISEIGWNVCTPNTYSLDNYTIRMGVTQGIGSTHFIGPFTTVLVIPSYMANVGWDMITLDQTFTFCDGNNLILDVCWMNTGTSNTGKTHQDNVAPILKRYRVSNFIPLCTNYFTPYSEVWRSQCQFVVTTSVCKGGSNYEKEAISIQSNFETIRVYPNPFSKTTTFSFTVMDAGQVTLEIYNLEGVRVATIFREVVKANSKHNAELNAVDLSTGIYFYNLTTGTRVYRSKLIIVR